MKPLFIHFLLQLFLCTSVAFAQTSIPYNPPPTGAKGPEAALPSGDAMKNAIITYALLPAPNNTWGYDILVDKRLMIHQTTPPGMPGNEGFKTRAGAESVAKLVISKMKKGEMPPSVTPEEMKKLKAI